MKNYINRILNLTKNSFFEPFKIEWLDINTNKIESFYLENQDHLKGEKYLEIEVIGIEENLSMFLKDVLNSIERYPYVWPLSNIKLDPNGYDFSKTSNGIEIEKVALITAREKLNLPIKQEGLIRPYKKPEFVSGGHLTKFSLTLEKASPLSKLSFRMHSVLPIRLASLVYESDTSGYSEPMLVDLETLNVKQSNESIVILFGEAIFAKRLTFVLAQDNALSNIYYIDKKSEDFMLYPDRKDQDFLSMLMKQTNDSNISLNNNPKEDWSEERKNSYKNWIEKNER